MLWTAEEGYFLLARHLERLEQSALYFGFNIDLPAVRLELERLAARLARKRQKVRLLVAREGRVTLEAEVLPALDPALQRVTVARGPADTSNPFLYHKTTNRDLYEAARTACPGYDDVLLYNEKGEVTESTIANLAVELEGKLCTPPVRCGLLPGTLRADLLARGALFERSITIEEMRRSPGVFLLNSVRGMYQVQLVEAPENRVDCSESWLSSSSSH
jgi:para-aminobenzoate synthetase/4-amino-4-deoxychorismate lyase